MSSPSSTGTCTLCGKSFNRSAMSRHLKTCTLAPPAKPNSPAFHLFIDARHDKSYWLHVAIPMESPLRLLDAFLRGIWLECCGHLSAFTIAGELYECETEAGRKGMQVRLNRVLQPGLSFSYEYDYGSTTRLNLKIVDVWERGTTKNSVELLARNDAPQTVCQLCGERPAAEICTECAWNDAGYLCETCAEEHDCGNNTWLPVVNSPRAGICGYTG